MGQSNNNQEEEEIEFPEIFDIKSLEEKGKKLRDFFNKGCSCKITFVVPMLAKMKCNLTFSEQNILFSFEVQQFVDACIQYSNDSNYSKNSVVTKLAASLPESTKMTGISKYNPPDYNLCYYFVDTKNSLQYVWKEKITETGERLVQRVNPKTIKKKNADTAKIFIEQCERWVCLPEILELLPQMRELKNHTSGFSFSSNENEVISISVGLTNPKDKRDHKLYISQEFPESYGLLSQVPVFFNSFYALTNRDIPETVLKQKGTKLQKWNLKSLIKTKQDEIDEAKQLKEKKMEEDLYGDDFSSDDSDI